jgi:hypothetical protein
VSVVLQTPQQVSQRPVRATAEMRIDIDFDHSDQLRRAWHWTRFLGAGVRDAIFAVTDRTLARPLPGVVPVIFHFGTWARQNADHPSAKIPGGDPPCGSVALDKMGEHHARRAA